MARAIRIPSHGLRQVCGGAFLAVILGTLLALPARGADALAFLGFDAAEYSPEARAGLEEIFGGRCFHGGFPAANAKLMLRAMTGAKNLGYDPDSLEGRFYAFGRLPSPPDRSVGSDPSFGLGESVFDHDGTPHVIFNCFMCHAGVVNGQVVAGLGNSHINQSDPRKLRARGDNFGPYEVWKLGARLVDPAGQGLVLSKERTELQQLLESLDLPPVDPMPWWLMKYKKLDYWYADGGVDNAAHFSVNFTTPSEGMNERRPEHVQIVARALAFARETQSPIYPGSLDAELVRKGADLFHGRARPADAQGFVACKTCHGSYTKKVADADLSQPGAWHVDYDFSHVLRNVKTDTAYNDTLKQLRPIADHINKMEAFFASTPELIPHATVPDKDGYVAPPLVGVWASAPYFHNGSVPSIEAVLNSAERPEIWARESRDPHAYDLEKVGMRYRPVERAEFEAAAAAAKGKPFTSQAAVDYSSMYDTRAYGHANAGHPFGDRLNGEERRAVIEFLKSLSGPEM